ncbi:MAG: phage/plasmid primase, P4 family [Eubacteriales bacterium]|nr:phage/plasmid primase, P4 family [Eubacteriales bacterium]
MAELRKDIPVTYEFEDYIPPEEDGVIVEPQDDSRMVMAERSSGEPFNPPDSWYTAEPDVAYTLGVEDKEKREAFLKSMPDPNLGRPRVSTGRPAGKKNLSRRTMSDEVQASSGAERNLDYATGGSPARRTMSDEAGASSGAGTNNDYARGAQPPWWNGKKLDTTAFCREYLKSHDIRCINGTFFTPDGYCQTEDIKAEIYGLIKDYVRSFPAQTAGNIVENLKIEAKSKELLVDENLIHFANGTYNASTCLKTDEKLFCRNRLPVDYTGVTAKAPEHWMRFVNELLEPEDVKTLQEFMGYCMIPSTRAQKMLLIIGNGGEGKSRIGVVMRAILGDNMNYGSIPKLETNSFARADLEHKLLMVDDDMRMENLPTTNNLKALITADGPMDLEKKGVQSYQGLMYCRLMAFSNGFLRSANDDSYGFFRRQLILMTKPRAKDRADDPFLSDKLRAEKEQIAVWALDGLYRLRKQNFRFTVSDRSKAAIMSAMDEANNVVSFLRSKGSFTFDPEGEITSREFYNIYKCWCDDNAIEPVSKRQVIGYLRAHCHEYGMTYGNVRYQYKLVRGFRGMRPGMATPINPVQSA